MKRNSNTLTKEGIMKLIAITTLLLSFLFIMKTEAGTLRIMSYNVENLFDTAHDEGKNDWSFLPKDFPGKKQACSQVANNHFREECFGADWIEDRVATKFIQINKVVKYNGKLPDLLGLIEVENQEIVERLAKNLGYTKVIITNSPDERGIDVALLFKNKSSLKFLGYKEHVLSIKNNFTRNILEVNFKVGKNLVDVFVNHWPSPGNPSEHRFIAATKLKEIIDLRVAEGHQTVIMGDFNVSSTESPSSINEIILKDNSFLDLKNEFLNSPKVEDSLKEKMSPGTYFFVKDYSWNNLDRIFVSKNLIDGSEKTQARVESFKIVAEDFMKRTFTYDYQNSPHYGKKVQLPWRYNHKESNPDYAGFSDHFPVEVTLQY